GSPGQRRLRIAGQQPDRYAEPLEWRHDGQDLVRLAGVRQRDHDVPARDHSEIAVNAFGRMKEIGGRPSRGQRGGDLPSEDPGLPHPGHDHATPTALEQWPAPSKALVDLGQESQERCGFQAQDAFGQPARVGHPRMAIVIARISRSNRGRSSIRSMFGPSDSGRPSSSVRSGSSCISMNSASTPTATAARASAGTYWRSPPERSPPAPGSWTECVASTTTGNPIARIWTRAHISTTSV